jgi:uncharacterized RDD family membrane protein YckC
MMRLRSARPASLRRRAVAACVEGWPGGAIRLLLGRLDIEELDPRQARVLVAAGYALTGADWWIARAAFGRQSLALAIAGVELVTRHGRTASLLRCYVRRVGPGNLVRPFRRRLAPDLSTGWQVAELAVSGVINVAVVLVRDDHRSVGDLIAGTRLVEAR